MKSLLVIRRAAGAAFDREAKRPSDYWIAKGHNTESCGADEQGGDGADRAASAGGERRTAAGSGTARDQHAALLIDGVVRPVKTCRGCDAGGVWGGREKLYPDVAIHSAAHPGAANPQLPRSLSIQRRTTSPPGPPSLSPTREQHWPRLTRLVGPSPIRPSADRTIPRSSPPPLNRSATITPRK